MKQLALALAALALALAGCAPSLATTPQDAVVYAGNVAEVRTTLIQEVRNYSPGPGYTRWQWDSTSPSTTRFVSYREFGAVDWVLTFLTLGIWAINAQAPMTFTCQLVGGESRTSVLCSPAYQFIYDILDAKYQRI